jgi:Tol biopolymer transport system component
MARFEREAQVLASLNHPNIAAIYGLEQSDGVRALAMELVEGTTLAERIAFAVVPLLDALDIACQIAEAMEYAHDRGIIHRDLKPGNVKITKEGVVKVLDFGLAKATEPVEPAGDPMRSPTITLPISHGGYILGTAAYMSPEQASGRPVDKRSDIWSYGVVLWELLTGERLFNGETVAHTMADILRAEIDQGRLPRHTPAPIRKLLARCLDRNVKTRLRDIGEARIVLNDLLARPAQVALSAEEDTISQRRLLWRVLPWAVAVLAVTLAAGLAFFPLRRVAEPAYPVRFQVPQPEKAIVRAQDLPMISPDGRMLAFTAIHTNGQAMLWLRPLNSLEPSPVAGTEAAYFPFWSPDSRSVAFFSGTKLRKVDVSGGAPATLCEDLRALGMGGTWSRESGILIGIEGGPLQRVMDTGEAVALLTLDRGRNETSQIWPHFLPDGVTFLYVSRSSKPGVTGVYAATVGKSETKMIMGGETVPWFSPPGFLLYTRQETLVAQPFDIRSLRLTGESFVVTEGVGRIIETHGSLYSVSRNGTIIYRGSSSPGQRITAYSREGEFLSTVGEPGLIRQIALSPDESRLVMERLDIKTRTWDLWLYEMAGGILSRLTLDSQNDSDPVWSPDSRQILFNSDRNGAFDLFRKDIGAIEEELLVRSQSKKVPEDWLKDDSVLYGDHAGRIYYRLTLGGKSAPVEVLRSEFTHDEPHISPDQKHVAYGSIESGRWEVYVAAYPAMGNKRQVSNKGGGQPRWRRDGRELYYLAPDGRMMAVEVRPGSRIETRPPRVLFETRLRPGATMEQYAVNGDGSRFFLVEQVMEQDQPMTVLLNWNSSQQPGSVFLPEPSR